MASQELELVLGMLRANPPISGGDIREMRAGMDALTANVPLPEDVQVEPVDAGGVPAEWTVAEGAEKALP
jgi:monoterpene epsilon-lactone hydrolase